MCLTTQRTPHLALSPWCSACNGRISEGESTLSFFGDDKHPLSYTLTKTFPFPSLGISIAETNGFLLCLNPTCRACRVSPECLAVHRHCLITFVKSCGLPLYQAIRRFRIIISYRKPWAKAPQLHLSLGQLRQGFENIAQNSDLIGLCRLPQELRNMIQQFSPQAWLWRLMSVIDLSRRVNQPAGPLEVFRLEDIQIWKRGENVVTSDNNVQSAIRVTIDSDGIQSIIRVPKQADFYPQVSRYYAYVVDEVKEFSGVQACVQDGLLRLHLPSKKEGLLIWDTPKPPRVADCHLQPSLRWHMQRLSTIDLSNIQGITFFYSTGRIYGIFPHESQKSCALLMFKRFTPKRQKHTVWVYLPISRHDKVLVLGIRQNDEDGMCIMVRTERGSDIILGPQCCSVKCDRFLSKSKPSLLVVNEPSGDIPVIPAAYDPHWSLAENPRRFVFPPCTPQRLGLSTYFSSAPLAEIRCAYVFEDEEQGLCRGMLFEYANGSSRAVGQCRLGVDRRKRYIEPLSISYRTSSRKDQFDRVLNGVHVELGTRLTSGREDWSSWLFPKTLHCWFSEQCTILSVD